MAEITKSRFQALRADYLGLVMALATAILVLAYLAWTSYQDNLARAEGAAAGMARLLAGDLRQALHTADELLNDVSTRAAPHAASAPEFEQFWQREKLHLGSFLAYNPEFSRLHVFDRDGRLVYATDDVVSPIKVVDRAYFQALKKRPGQGLYISEVINSRVNGRPTIMLARALQGPHGAFAGVVAIPVDYRFLETVLEGFDVGPHGVLVIRHSDDSRLVGRQPSRPEAVNRPAAGHAFQGRLDAGERRGLAVLSGQGDGVERIYAFEKVDAYPWYVVAGLATEDVLAGWRGRLLLAMGLAAAALASLIFLYRRLADAHARLAATAADLQKLKLAVDQSPVSIVITDMEGGIQYANPAFSENSGYALTEVLGQTPRVLKSGETTAEEYETLWHTITQGRSWKGVFHNRRKNGELYWESALISPVVDGAGKVTSFLGIKQNITEQYEAAAALSERERLLSAIFETSSVGIFLVGLDGRLTLANRRLGEMFGREPAALAGREYAEFIDPAERETGRANMARLIAGDIDHVDLERLYGRPDGASFWGELTARRLLDASGRVAGVLGIIADVSSRRAAEDSLSRMNRLLQDVLAAASTLAIVAVDREGVVTVFNRGAEIMLGYGAAEVVGKATPELWHLPGEMAARGEELGRETGRAASGFRVLVAGAEAAGREEREWTYVRRDGCQLRVSLVVTVMRTGQGEVAGYLGIAQDITERQRVGAELDRYRDRLEELVEERTRQIEILNAELQDRAREAEAACRAKSSFLANMSHEIRTPMNAIVGLTHLLRRTAADPGQQDKLAKISAAAAHLLQIIGDILDYSKIEADRLQLDQVDFDLRQLLQQVCARVADAARAKDLQLSLEVAPDLAAIGPLTGDPARLAQALLNYGANAVKFTEAGSITVRARLLEAAAADVLVRLEVEDTGIGIGADELQRLFAAFEQADASTTRRFGGTGLGLVITRGLVRLMGGTVGVESRPGAGSIFWLTARLGRSPGRSAPPDLALPGPATAPETAPAPDGERGAPSTPPPGERCMAVAHRLEQLLADDDFRAGEVISEGGAMLQELFGARAGRLAEDVRNFNYPAALATLRQAMQGVPEPGGTAPAGCLDKAAPGKDIVTDGKNDFE